jgi:hypothetical protein
MGKTNEQKTLELLNAATGPLKMVEIAKKLKVDVSTMEGDRAMDNLLRRMKKAHQIKFYTGVGGGWRITEVGKHVLAGLLPAVPQPKKMPKLTKKPEPVAAPAPTTPVVDQSKLTNHFAIVFDRSGSMQSCKDAAQNAGNANIHAIQEQAQKTGQMTTVTVCQFDNEINFDYVMMPAKDAKDFKLVPRNDTALIAAVLKTIEKLAAFPDVDQKTTSFVVQVVTDGAENASGRHSGATWDALKKKLSEMQGTDRWTFVFLVPNEYAKNHLVQMGVPTGNIEVWEATDKGAKEMEVKTSAAIGSYYSVRSAGATKSSNYFKPDLSKLKPEDLAKLTDIRGNCYLWNVDKEQPIQAFVESKLGHYQPGKAFYPLTKKEEVQSYKQIALRDRMTEALYTGPEARALIGLPNSDVKIEPGDHGKFDIFIMSTSNNRKLVRGSKLLYMK